VPWNWAWFLGPAHAIIPRDDYQWSCSVNEMVKVEPQAVPQAASGLDGIECVVAEPLRFKAKLAIGENAYASLRMVNRGRELWDVLGAAGAGAAIAKSSMVASAFFAPSGVVGALGVGAAATPVGWVALAALASGGACYGMYRWLGASKGSRVIEIPRCLNTPLDTLGLALFDLIAPLSLRLAAGPYGVVPPQRHAFLAAHLVDEWGLDERFVARAMAVVEPGLADASPQELARELAAFLHANPDCNHQVIAAEMGAFLAQMLEAGGAALAEPEQQLLAQVQQTLQTPPPGEAAKAWTQAKGHANHYGGQVAGAAGKAAAWTKEQLRTAQQIGELTMRGKELPGQIAGAVGKAASWTKEQMPTPQQVEELKKRGEALTGQAVDGLRSATQAAQGALPTAEQVQQGARRTGVLARQGLDLLKAKLGR
jgi:hypothetical protein